MLNPIKILFIGSNPSNKAQSNEAFTSDTASGRLVRSWTDGIQGTIYYENIVSQKTENNRPLNQNEMAHASASLLERIKGINPDRIVALGKSATKTIESLGLKCFEMPHPSGLNRLLNDKKYTDKKLKELKSFCSS